MAKSSESSFVPVPRKRAMALHPVADPAGWTAADYREAEPWVHRISEPAIADVLRAVSDVERRNVDLTEISREDFSLGAAGTATISRMRQTLTEGVGFVQVRGLPVARLTRRQAAIAFLGIGAHLGNRVAQNEDGHILGHIKDIGKPVGDLSTRNYQTSAAIGFHTDSCDFVALMCLKTALRGGESRIVSSVNIYNELLARHPDLMEVLVEDFYWMRHGKFVPGETPWYRQPAFSFVDGYFSCRGVSVRVDKAQKLPGVPPLTERQRQAIALFRQLTDELSVDIPFVEGDFQILCNHVILHSRRPFENPEEPSEKRHLLRLWLRNDNIRPIPSTVRDDFYGVKVDTGRIVAPLDAEPVG